MKIAVSFVVPTLYAPSLEKTLLSISYQTMSSYIEDIIVVGSQMDGDWVKIPKVKYIANTDKPTPARNRNLGVKYSSGNWICFVDADCYLSQDWLEECLKHVEAYKPEAVCGSILLPPDSSYWTQCDHFLSFASFRQSNSQPKWISHCPSMSMLVSKEVFERVGGFDESFVKASGEDFEFCDRLQRWKGRILFVPTAKAFHNHQRHHFLSVWQHLYNYGFTLMQRREKSYLNKSWKFFLRVASIPGLLETLGLVRVLTRIPKHIHIARQPGSGYDLSLLPGILALDVAISLGIVHGIREGSMRRCTHPW